MSKKPPMLSSKDFSEFRNQSPVQMFEDFISQVIISLFLTENTTYAVYKNDEDPKTSSEEIKVFLVILTLSGYNSVPGKKIWKIGKDIRNKMIYQVVHVVSNFKIDFMKKLVQRRTSTSTNQ